MTANQWGTYSPRGFNRFLHLLVQVGLVRGPCKRMVSRCWAGRTTHTPIDISRSGLKLRVHPWDNTVEFKLLFGSGSRDRQELTAIKRAVAGGGTFIDVGANIGFYALMAARLGAARVLAVEPNPAMCERMRFNISANDAFLRSAATDRIAIAPVALGEREDEVELVLAGDVGASRISTSAENPDLKTVRVPMKPFLQVVNEANMTRIDAMKIDVEGMEDAVLMPFFEHAPRSLWPGVVVMEHVWSSRWSRDVLQWMLHSGYTETARTRSNTVLHLSNREAR